MIVPGLLIMFSAVLDQPRCVKWTWTGDVYNRRVVCLEWTKPKDKEPKKNA